MARDTQTVGEITALRQSQQSATATVPRPLAEILSRTAPAKLHVVDVKSGRRSIKDQLRKKVKAPKEQRKRPLAAGD